MTMPDEWEEEDYEDMEFELQQLEMLDMELEEEELKLAEDEEEMAHIERGEVDDLKWAEQQVRKLYFLRVQIDAETNAPSIKKLVSVSGELIEYIQSYQDKYPELWAKVEKEVTEISKEMADMPVELTDEEKEI